MQGLYGVSPQATHEQVPSLFKLPELWFLEGVRREVEATSAEDFHHEERY